MTPSYESVCKILRVRAEAAVKADLVSIERTHEVRAEHVRAISQATADYMATGIADLRNLPYLSIRYHNIGWSNKGWSWGQYFRGLAKDLGRPYVRVYQSYRGGGGTGVILPNRRYMDPLIAALRLACKCSHDTVNQWVTFGEDQAELLTAWRKQCATEPAFRKVLRLP